MGRHPACLLQNLDSWGSIYAYATGQFVIKHKTKLTHSRSSITNTNIKVRLSFINNMIIHVAIGNYAYNSMVG